LFSVGRRDTTEIVYDILTLAQTGVSRGQIVRNGRLSFRLANQYTSQLKVLGLIQKSDSAESVERYELTKKGARVLRLLSNLEEELGGDGSATQLETQLQQGTSPLANPSETSNDIPLFTNLDRMTKLTAALHISAFLAGVGLGYVLP
jgi:predicted transcriptional regulator